MTWDNSKQFHSHMNGLMVETGEASFSTTGLTVDVDTYLSTVLAAFVTAKAANGDPIETLYCDRTITTGCVTVTREVKPYVLRGFSDDAVHIADTYQWLKLPIGYVPWAGTINRLTVYNTTKAGGAPVISLGSNLVEKTGLSRVDTTNVITGTAGDFSSLAVGDKVWVNGTHITAGIGTVSAVATDGSTVTVTGLTATDDDSDVTVDTRCRYISSVEAKAFPADVSDSSVTAATDFVGDALPTVSVGEVLNITSTGGGTSAPSGLMAEVEITPTPTSGLTFSYMFVGLS